jgi:hypothetical protein
MKKVIVLIVMLCALTANATRTYGDNDETWGEVLRPQIIWTWCLLILPQTRLMHGRRWA